MLNVRMGSYIDLSFDFRLLHVLVKALLHVKKFLVFLGQQFLHGGNRCRPENLILVFLGCLLCAVRVILNLKCTRALGVMIIGSWRRKPWMDRFSEHASKAAVRAWLRTVGWSGIRGELTWDAQLTARIPEEEVCVKAGPRELQHEELIVAKLLAKRIRDLVTLCDIG